MAKGNDDLDKIISKIVKIVGGSNAEIDPKAPNRAIVRPRTSDDVCRIVKIALKEGVPIVPNRHLIWAVEDKYSDEHLLINTLDMNGIFKIDEENLAVTVGPGVLWKDLYKALLKRGYLIGAYPFSSIPTVGEWVDTGGGGIGSYGKGFAGDQVRTLEVVLPDGKVINTGFEKVLSNSSGYNLNGLFIGAESTLGIITKITLKIFPKPEETRPLYYTFSELKDTTEALRALTKIKTTPMNISFFSANHLQSLKMFRKDIPDLKGVVMNVTLTGLRSVVDHEEENIDAIMKGHNAIKVSSDIAKVLWRERFFEVPSTRAGIRPVFFEALIPASKLYEMANGTYSLIGKIKQKAAIIGILCDRSTVLLIPYLLSEKSSTKKSRMPAVFAQKYGELVVKHGGRPIGTTMSLISGIKQVNGEELNTILDIKSAIDPHDIMNPYRFI
ncbi:MAG: FAD-binding oxidoreductase [Methanomassiliicoccales archaeon]|nr:MAG: FAD-binding oxidoreductase [Methanomassiliicoccales archaeon]